MNKQCKFALIPAIAVLVSFLLPASSGLIQHANALETVNLNFSLLDQTPLPCYGPCILSNVSQRQVNLGEAVTVSGQICPPADNVTVRVTFTRPDYTWVDQYDLADNVTGEFSVTQKLDMHGFWNVFPIYGHISDRLYVNVTDPANPLAPEPTPQTRLPAYRPNWILIGLAAVLGSAGRQLSPRHCCDCCFLSTV